MNDKAINVLLIEDNPGDARLIREMLTESRGALFDLECADCLSTGLERLAVVDIDVVLLDLGLPDSRGLDTFVRARAQAPDDAQLRAHLEALDAEIAKLDGAATASP